VTSFSPLVARLAMATVEVSSRSSELDRCIRALPKRRIGELDEVNEPRKESSVVTPTAPAPPVAQPRTTSEIVEQILADATPDVQASLSYRLAKQYFDSAQPASVVPPVTLPTKAAKLVEGIPVVPVEATSEEVSFPLFGEAGVKVTETLGALSLFAAVVSLVGSGPQRRDCRCRYPPRRVRTTRATRMRMETLGEETGHSRVRTRRRVGATRRRGRSQERSWIRTKRRWVEWWMPERLVSALMPRSV
jgi:hypothetical protein